MPHLLSDLFCLMGFHRYHWPTRDGGRRCRCRRVRYLVIW